MNPDASNVEFLAVDGTNFDFLTEAVAARTARLVIDSGPDSLEVYRVATNVERDPGGAFAGITMEDVLTEVLEIPFTTELRTWTEDDGSKYTERKLISLRELGTTPPTVEGALPLTAWAVKNVQAMFGYDIDGIVGPGTTKLIDAQVGYGWSAKAADAQQRALKAQGLKE